MKKTITVITLALLMVASLFAKIVTPASGTTTVNSDNTATTKVVLTIAKTPTYIFGINTSSSIDINKKNVPATDIENATEIKLERYTTDDTDKNVLDVKPNASYYLSYLFYEYDAVTLTMSLSGNLKLKGVTEDNKADNSSANQIPYLVTVGAASEKNQDDSDSGKSYTAITLDSSDSSKNTWTTNGYTATDKLGQYVYSTLNLEISPKYSSENTTNTDPTLKGKTKGTYESTITLTVTAN